MKQLEKVAVISVEGLWRGGFVSIRDSTESALLYNALLEVLCSGWNVEQRSSLLSLIHI